MYDVVYEELNLDAVDAETQKYVKRLAKTITKLKISEDKRKRIEYIWQQERASAMKSAIPNPLGVFSAIKSLSLADLALSGLYIIADSVTGYQYAINSANLNYVKQGWEIDDTELIDIDALNGDLWDYKNNMRRENNIPADLILNKDLIEDFVKNENIDENGNGGNSEYYKKCLNAVREYEKNSARIFKKDIDFARVIPLAIACAEKVESTGTYIETLKHYVDILEKNIKTRNWDLQYFLSQCYVKLNLLTNSNEYLDKAYSLVKANTSNLVEEQKMMNDEYFGEFKEEEIPKTATKEEKKEIKQRNKDRKEAREYELPPVLDNLALNCQLLFELADKKKITNSEKTIIDSILHNHDEFLFPLDPLDDLYWYNMPEGYEKPDYSDSIVNYGDFFEIPVKLIGDKSDIIVTYSDGGTQKTYDLWNCTVDRKKGIATVFMKIYDTEKDKIKNIDYKITKDTKMNINIQPVIGSNCEAIVADYYNDKGLVFDDWVRVK